MIGVIQARMGSIRLPGKMLADIHGKPLFQRIVERVQASKLCPRWVLSTSNDPRNQPLIDCARSLGLDYFIGSEEDLAQRLYGTAQAFQAEALVKVNGDCVLIDPQVIDQVVETYLETEPRADHVSNKGEWTFPLGQSVEVISTRALEICFRELHEPQQRELVAKYIMEHPERFCVRTVVLDQDLSEHQWMVDTPEDLEFVRRIFAELEQPGHPFSMYDILELFKEARI
jgi:spore coat polysaccharide biosynthesis protein SpsF